MLIILMDLVKHNIQEVFLSETLFIHIIIFEFRKQSRKHKESNIISIFCGRVNLQEKDPKKITRRIKRFRLM